MTDFQIPLSPEDLFSSFNSGVSFRVKKKPDTVSLSPSECISCLNDLELALKKDPTKIFSVGASETFDKIFGLVLGVNSLSVSAKTKLEKLLVDSLKRFCHMIVDDFHEEKCRIYRNTLKMYIYLEYVLLSKAFNEKSIFSIVEVVEIDLLRIWQTNKLEVSFSDLLFKIVCLFLEKPNILKMKNVKESVFHLLRCLSKLSDLNASLILDLIMKYEHLGGPFSEFLQLLVSDIVEPSAVNPNDADSSVVPTINEENHHEDKMDPALPNFQAEKEIVVVLGEEEEEEEKQLNVKNIEEDGLLHTRVHSYAGNTFHSNPTKSDLSVSSQLCSELFAAIGKLNDSDLLASVDGSKLLAGFVEEFVSKCPRESIKHLPVLIPHLNNELYQIRNAILVSVSRAVVESRDDPEARSSLIEILIERLRDSNAVCKTRRFFIGSEGVDKCG